MEEIVLALLKTNTELCDKIISLALQVVKLQLPNYASAEGIRVATVPWHMDEAEQEAKFKLDTGALDVSEYEEILKGLNFDNTTIDIM